MRTADEPTFVLTITDPCTEVVIDVSLVSVKQIKFSDGTNTVTKTASFTTDGTDGKIQATLDAADITVAGDWSYQGLVTMAGGTEFATSAVRLKVEERL
jgi:hypothetical protein